MAMDEQQINLLRPEYEQPTKKGKPIKIIILIIGVALVGLLGLRAVLSISSPNGSSLNKLKPKKAGFFESVKNYILNTPESVVDGETTDRVNILLLGIGGPGHDGPYLSDTNIIVSIKPSTNQVALISVPRDLGVKINGYGIRKINHADAFGEAEKYGNGGEYARKIFEETFGIEIPYYVRVDFKAFKELVDSVGGIKINIEKPFTDSAYPGPNYSFQTISFEAGTQILNGERALIFARSRHGTNGEASDFSRAKRQQLVISALKEKFMSAGTYLNPIKIQKIYGALNDNISTNLDFGQIMYLATLAKELQIEDTKKLILDDSPNGYLRPMISDSGAYLLGPKSGNYSEIKIAVDNIFNATTTTTTELPVKEDATEEPTKSLAKIEIQNGTWRAGLAAAKKQELTTDGFSVIWVGNALKRPIAKTTIYIINPIISSETADAITKKLNAPSSTILPEWLQENYDDPATIANEQGLKYKREADILVLLGEDIK